jgi:hypothetical protein
MVPDGDTAGEVSTLCLPLSIWHQESERLHGGRRGADATKMVLGEAAVGWQPRATSKGPRVPCSLVVTLRLLAGATVRAGYVAADAS